MRLSRLYAENFSSYKVLEFDFTGQGLTLIKGETGSGKSTLMDAVSWCLFGQTAKGGGVDDVRSWQADEPTTGKLSIQLSGGRSLEVVRTRGGSGRNDCYFCEQGDESNHRPIRGKDLPDTQRLLEARLGISAECFLTSSYSHEYSSHGTFFNSPAKKRREVLEGLADLELARSLAEGVKEARTRTKAERDRFGSSFESNDGKLQATRKAFERCKHLSAEWESKRQFRLDYLQSKTSIFDKEKAKEVQELVQKDEEWKKEHNRLEEEILDDNWYVKKLDTLKAEAKCRSCGNLPMNATEEMTRVAILRANNKDKITKFRQSNPYTQLLAQAKGKVNSYLEQLEEAKAEENPYVPNISIYEDEVYHLEHELKHLKLEIADCNKKLASLDQIYSLSSTLRATILFNTVKHLQSETNRYLETYFEGAFRVGFTLTEDALNVSITKNGYDCNFKQLSKGQRGLLRLCFVITVMQATADNASIKIEQLFLDEVCDGMDSNLKVSAFRLFQELTERYDSIFVIDHSAELQSLFQNRYSIELVNDYSVITHES